MPSCLLTNNQGLDEEARPARRTRFKSLRLFAQEQKTLAAFLLSKIWITSLRYLGAWPTINNMEPMESVHQRFSPKTLLPVLLALVLIGVGGYFAYLKYFDYQNDKKLANSTPEQAINVLKKFDIVSTASARAEVAIGIGAIPSDVSPFVPKSNDTIKLYQLGYDNGDVGYKISYAYFDQRIPEVKDALSSLAITDSGYTFIQAVHNKSKPVWVLTFENAKYFLKINIVSTDDTSGTVGIILTPK